MSESRSPTPTAARKFTSQPTPTPEDTTSCNAQTKRLILEVCCETLADVLAAEACGADRIELCSALDIGGLTPSLGLLLATRSAVSLPMWVMIRPRGGDFVYSTDEADVMVRDIELCRGAEPAGFVFGVLHPDGRVNRDICRRLLDACGNIPAVFHRAFDRTPALTEAIGAVTELGFRRILTSGREPTAAAGARTIARVRDCAAGLVEVLPCGQVRAENLEQLLRTTGCDQFHGSFSEVVPVGTEEGYRGYGQRMRVSREQVAAARIELNRLAELLATEGNNRRRLAHK
ncbi:MAG: copper homeostasis protein CutC [Planctomycetes bacterium]|nr:copper homeostasis protein CutC [Planctomycetota bacterium]